MTNYIARGRSLVVPLQNDTAGTVGEGAVVVLTGTESFDVTTTPNLATDIIGVALESIATTATGRVCIGGYVEKINLNNTAGAGDYLYTTNVEKLGVASATLESGAFGQAVDSGATPSAILFINPVRFIDTDPIWEAEGDLLVGTGPGTAEILSIGAAGEVLTVSGGTAVWDTLDGLPGGSAEGDVLTIVGGNPTWDAPTTVDLGFTAQGDLLVGTGGDNWTALGIGAEGEVLTVSGGDAAWAAASGGDNIYFSLFTSADNVSYPDWAAAPPGLFLEDGVETQVDTAFVFPRTGTVSIYALLYADTIGLGGGGNVILGHYYNISARDGNYGAVTSNTQTAQTFTVPDNTEKMHWYEINTGVSVSAGDTLYIYIEFNRDDVGDTFTNTLAIFALGIEYTA